MAKRTSNYDAIIAGAGPVGLFLAGELALAGCSVLILEKAQNPHSPLKRLPFGSRGLSALSVEGLYRRRLLNVSKRVKAHFGNSSKAQGSLPHVQAGHFAGIPFYLDNIDTTQWKYRLPSSTDSGMGTDMEELEFVLTERAETLGVEIRRGAAVTGFQQSDDGVTVEAGGRSFQGQWLVACDGGRSAVRKAGGFEFAGTDPEFTCYAAHVDIADGWKLRPGRTATATGMYFKRQSDYLMMLEFDGGAFHKSDKSITLEYVQELIRRVSNTDVTIRTLHLATSWTDRARQATTYRDGRILLAGDAAHIHSPLGGQGLNLGLGDAMNLGWKLAATIHGRAPEGLLDSYYSERHPIGAQVLDWSRAQIAIMRPDPHARALNAIIGDLLNTRDGATYIAGRLSGMYTQYDLGGDNPIVGHSVPNFELEDGTMIGEVMHDGHGVLLDFIGSASLKKVAGEYRDQINYVSGRAEEQFGLSAVLVRPDGFVAWAAESEPNEHSLRQAVSRWFV
jgi:2-polyprenyl-6-methoxyphenol hydroxylase-like FAD-dependent oxidoreductase